MSRVPEPLVRWRIHPDDKVPSRHVVVQVFRTLRELRAWSGRFGGRTHYESGYVSTSKSRFRHALGVCMVWPHRREIATVSLAKMHCYPRVACHEFQHATMAYLNRCILKSQQGWLVSLDAPELIFGPVGEQLASFNGNLNREFYNRLHEAGLAE